MKFTDYSTISKSISVVSFNESDQMVQTEYAQNKHKLSHPISPCSISSTKSTSSSLPSSFSLSTTAPNDKVIETPHLPFSPLILAAAAKACPKVSNKIRSGRKKNCADYINKLKYKKDGRWTDCEHKMFLIGMKLYGHEWKKVAMHIPTRTSTQVRSHAQKYFRKFECTSNKEENKEVIDIKKQEHDNNVTDDIKRQEKLEHDSNVTASIKVQDKQEQDQQHQLLEQHHVESPQHIQYQKNSTVDINEYNSVNKEKSVCNDHESIANALLLLHQKPRNLIRTNNYKSNIMSNTELISNNPMKQNLTNYSISCPSLDSTTISSASNSNTSNINYKRKRDINVVVAENYYCNISDSSSTTKNDDISVVSDSEKSVIGWNKSNSDTISNEVERTLFQLKQRFIHLQEVKSFLMK